ncbi:hypothetical protein Nocox_40555 [Nonomuraea coxensis DSM 45129]|uniref:Uncharacterized protein n=1 Tax=Nonomuraea coxensis DSM 45129 TaxID=1122611 RepID=A0ABX8UGI4_9ACTN|nr:hypothetical protein [Nonomuraea coxensis]QYC45654.1 hypothetical protein Nocox_40555 [Nonomuraea coxensis DSM 45129]
MHGSEPDAGSLLDVLVPAKDRPGALAVTLAGLLPSRAYHLELPTTVADRRAECYDHVLEA